MNNLNSILLEGILVADPTTVYVDRGELNGIARCSFDIESRRAVKVGETTADELSIFRVVTWSHLAETCQEWLKKGRGVRVIGRLVQNQTEIQIVGEHVEFRPERKTALAPAVK